MMTTTEVTLKVLKPEHIKDVLQIEMAVHASPWTEDTFLICFEAGYKGWYVEIDEEIVGFLMIALHRLDCHILNLCVAKTHQRQGLGKKMLNHALGYAKKKGTLIAYLEVRKSNQNAILLYQSLNFHLIGERKAYYPSAKGSEDALIFAMALQDTTTSMSS